MQKCEGIGGDASGVVVTNAKGAFSESLAEWCLHTMLYFDKQMPRVLQNGRSGAWDKFIMSELRGKTVGFVGFGSIAKATASLCRAFGMKVIALRRKPDNDVVEAGLAGKNSKSSSRAKPS